jgi:ATP-binding cassette subfamily B protein
LPHSRRTGLGRLTAYLQGKRMQVVAMLLVATGQAAAQTGGWLLVRAAIDNGIAKGDSEYLTVIVAIYLCVGAAGWVMSAILIRGLAGIGQGIVLGLRRDLFIHLTSLSVR